MERVEPREKTVPFGTVYPIGPKIVPITTAKQAMQMMQAHENYSGETTSDIRDRIYNAVAAEHAVFGKGVFFSWVRPRNRWTMDRLLQGYPLYQQDFEEQGKHLWIVDMVASADWTAYRLGRWMMAEVLLRSIAENRELCIFRRNGGIHAGRFGFTIVRKI